MANNWNTDNWIASSKKLYKKKFNYSKTSYVDCYTFITLGCPKHSWVKVNPGTHLKKILKKSGEKNLGCTECNFERRHLRDKRALFFPATQEKICLLCSVKKSVLEFSKNRNSSDGYYGYCRPCKKLKAKEKRNKVKSERIAKFKQENPGVYIDESKNFSLRKAFFFPETGEKICFGCKEKKKILNFYKSNKTEDGFDTYCKNCTLKIQQEYYINKYQSFEGRINEFLKNSKNNSKKRGQIFNINEKDLLDKWNSQKRKCYYSGLEMTTLPNNDLSVSIDRIDSEKGYTRRNIVFTTSIVNRMKNKFDSNVFLILCKAIANYNDKIASNISSNEYKILTKSFLRSKKPKKLNNNNKFEKPNFTKTKISKFSNSKQKSYYYADTNEKFCGKCQIVKNVSLFWKHSLTKDGYHSYCKECCLKNSRISKEKSYLTFKGRISTLLTSCKRNAKKRNQKFDLTKKDLLQVWNKQNQKCFYSGFKMLTVPNSHLTVSIERKNVKYGYIKSNIAFICASINTMRSDIELSDFFNTCKKISNYQKN